MNGGQTETIFTNEAADMAGRANFSPCGKYRYTLERAWSALPRYVLWIMLNPSTAGAAKNDATIRRCIGYARAWGYTGILVGNLYAWRSTKPRDLLTACAAGTDVIGEYNEHNLRGLIRRASLIVCAWGQSGPTNEAKSKVLQLLRPDADPYARIYQGALEPHYLKLNANAEPSHPLRLAKSLEPKRWAIFERLGNGHGG